MRVVVWLFFGLLCSAGAFANQPGANQPGLVTYTMLYDACTSVRHAQQGYCTGYVVAIGDVMTQETGLRTDLPPTCVRKSVEWDTAHDAVRRQLDPVLQNRVGLVRPVVENAWERAFPCMPSDYGSVPRTIAFLDGLDLQSWCKSRKSREQGMCLGYLVSVFERLTVVTEGEDGCLPPGLTGSTLAKRMSTRIARIQEEDALYAWLGDTAIDLVRRTAEILWSRPVETCDLIVRSKF